MNYRDRLSRYFEKTGESERPVAERPDAPPPPASAPAPTRTPTSAPPPPPAAGDEEPDFFFGVSDRRATFGREWGGEFRVLINQNVNVHLVPRFNEEMRRPDELPQFSIFSNDARAGETDIVRYEAVKDLDAFDGAVFYVSSAVYEGLVRELAAIAGRYPEFPRLRDTAYPDTLLVKLIATRILEHPLVQAERQYDFTKRTF